MLALDELRAPMGLICQPLTHPNPRPNLHKAGLQPAPAQLQPCTKTQAKRRAEAVYLATCMITTKLSRGAHSFTMCQAEYSWGVGDFRGLSETLHIAKSLVEPRPIPYKHSIPSSHFYRDTTTIEKMSHFLDEMKRQALRSPHLFPSRV
ncbi:hypothetical protein JZ751_008607 [Albula glossodonta]|uniref:Uncharacterized protein n=1 Tax=Albula glossodonta TaxID=121402 RepID=A0A8T2NWT7_9TELE|nr:hypothetical protein JZ751_008607 [Albula glossodonta]